MVDIEPGRHHQQPSDPSEEPSFPLGPVINGGRMPSAKRRKKRAREKESEEMEDSDVRDPLVVFGPDILTMILCHLDARSVAQSLLVSHGWHEVASSDLLWSVQLVAAWRMRIRRLRCLLCLRLCFVLCSYPLACLDREEQLHFKL